MPDTSQLLKAIQHPIRRQILHQLETTMSPISYSAFLPLCENSTGKLNYHLRILGDLIAKQEDRYVLSSTGRNIVGWLENILAESTHSKLSVSVVFPSFSPAVALIKKYFLMLSLSTFLLFVVTGILLSSLSAPIIAWVSVYISLVITIAVLFTFSAFYYRAIEYEINDTEIIVKRGIITHSNKVVPYRTVTNIEVKQGPFDRLFGIATIQIQTAGNSQTGVEEQLSGLIDARELNETILERIRLLNPPKFVAGENAAIQSLRPLLTELQSINEVLKE